MGKFGYGNKGDGTYRRFGPSKGPSGYAGEGPYTDFETGSEMFYAQEDNAIRIEHNKANGYALDRTFGQDEHIAFSSKFKGFFRGFGNFVTQPFAEIRNSMRSQRAQSAYDDHLISEQQYNYRMYQSGEAEAWRRYNVLHQISLEQYNDIVDKLEQQYPYNDEMEDRLSHN